MQIKINEWKLIVQLESIPLCTMPFQYSKMAKIPMETYLLMKSFQDGFLSTNLQDL